MLDVTQDDVVTTNENVNESVGEIANVIETVEAETVSYTHLDVYKRQANKCLCESK